MITVRRATAEDIPSLVRFNQGIARETEDLELDEGTLTEGVRRLVAEDRHGFYTVAEIDGRPVGSLMITYEWSDWRNGVIWWIQSVYVIAEHRRQGVFSALYENVQRLAQESGEVRAFRLYVEKENTVAQQTSQRLGMKETYYRLFESDSP